MRYFPNVTNCKCNSETLSVKYWSITVELKFCNFVIIDVLERAVGKKTLLFAYDVI